MSTFFSSTDTATLKEEGTDRNNFVSLIVNNAGSYTAAITRKVSHTKTIKDCCSYKFFGEGETTSCEDYSTINEEIEWFYLKITKEGESTSFQSIQDRLKEIRKNKAEKAKAKTAPIYGNSIAKKTPSAPAIPPIPSAPSNVTKWEDRYSSIYGYENYNEDSPLLNEDTPIVGSSYLEEKIGAQVLHSLVAQIITGCIIINSDKINLNDFVSNMVGAYDRRFGKGADGSLNFQIWAEALCEYLVWNIEDEELFAKGYDNTELSAIYANNIIEELKTFEPNDYIEGYIEALEKYLKI